MNTQPTQVDINEAMEYAAALKHCHDCFADRAAIVLYDELTAVTEQRDAVTLRLGNTQERMFDAERQRDRLAEAIRRHKETLPFAPQPCDKKLYEALQSLTPDQP
jgi:hypothetical protein